MTIKPTHATIIAGFTACAIVMTVAIWWLGPSPDAWPLMVQCVATLMAWVPSLVWLVHAYGYTHVDGWDYAGDDTWSKNIHHGGSTIVAYVQRKRGTRSYYVSFMVDDPFVDGALYVIREYKDFGDLTPVLEDATIEAVATLVEWLGSQRDVRGEREALYRSYYM